MNINFSVSCILLAILLCPSKKAHATYPWERDNSIELGVGGGFIGSASGDGFNVSGIRLTHQFGWLRAQLNANRTIANGQPGDSYALTLGGKTSNNIWVRGGIGIGIVVYENIQRVRFYDYDYVEIRERNRTNEKINTLTGFALNAAVGFDFYETRDKKKFFMGAGFDGIFKDSFAISGQLTTFLGMAW